MPLLLVLVNKHVYGVLLTNGYSFDSNYRIVQFGRVFRFLLFVQPNLLYSKPAQHLCKQNYEIVIHVQFVAVLLV